ncbi:hypothetical protein A33Q_4451 [Indibacter alkaliphilus LW1]|uniref:Uncharacterized protein n=1 Tax=Indibacter alkaliphilus (strain CCUG 57479 / KCTC 22604 / LW1) TaxID=1189612 RepID=S2DR28_INDAL|nr:hypothetical protein A33Q_4451 [Indibacter alkaliphilus LW1]
MLFFFPYFRQVAKEQDFFTKTAPPLTDKSTWLRLDTVVRITQLIIRKA